MSILAKHLPFVKAQCEFHRNRLKKPEVAKNPWRVKLHTETAEKFEALAIDLEASDGLLDAPPVAKRRPSSPVQLSLNIEEIADLPAELVQELSISEGDKTEFAVLNAVEEAGGVITLDRLLIALYRKTNEIHKRNTLTSRIYRMTSKGQLHNVPGKKGVYSNEPLTVEEAAKLFGTVKDAAVT